MLHEKNLFSIKQNKQKTKWHMSQFTATVRKKLDKTTVIKDLFSHDFKNMNSWSQVSIYKSVVRQTIMSEINATQSITAHDS